MKPSTESTQAIEAANREFEALFNSGDTAALAGLYDEDAQFVAAHMDPLVGRAAIETFLAGAKESGVATIVLTTDEVDADAESAVEYGRYVMKLADGAVADEGRYLVHWKKADGAWRLHRDMIATSIPTAG